MMEWYESIENLRQLAAYIQDKDGATALDTAEFLEKPWKWQDEFLEMMGVKEERQAEKEARENFDYHPEELELNCEVNS